MARSTFVAWMAGALFGALVGFSLGRVAGTMTQDCIPLDPPVKSVCKGPLAEAAE